MTTAVPNGHHPMVFTSPSIYQNSSDEKNFQTEKGHNNVQGSAINEVTQSQHDGYGNHKPISSDSIGVIGKRFPNGELRQTSKESNQNPSYSVFSSLPLPETTLSTNLQRGIHTNSQWTLESLQELKDEFIKLYEVAKTKQKQWKSDLKELDADKDSVHQVKRRKLNDSTVSEAPSWRFVNQVKRCDFVNANGVQCKRAGVCPFHGEGAEFIRGVSRKKHDRDIDLLVLAASTLERNELFNKSTPKKQVNINSSSQRLSTNNDSPTNEFRQTQNSVADE